MNYQLLNALYSEHKYDEIKVIGKDMEHDGKWAHIMGLTLKDQKATLYVLEFDADAVWEDEIEPEERDREKTTREQMKDGTRNRGNNGLFLHTREFRCNGVTYETAGGTSGPMKQNDPYETYMICLLMCQAGWQIEENSLFYHADWNHLSLTVLELREEYERLPDWDDNLTALVDVMPQSEIVEVPVTLELGKEQTVDFVLSDGSKAKCYINHVYLIDMWADNEKRFRDPEYREKMLQYMTEEEFANMKQQVMQTLSETCPKGKQYMAVEYECDRDISVTFYCKDDLDTVPEPKHGSASALLISVRPDEEFGSHGYKMRGCAIQTPVDADTKQLEAELFSYMELVKKVEIRVY